MNNCLETELIKNVTKDKILFLYSGGDEGVSE